MVDPATLSGANALLRAHGLRPRKRWGQNFLCNRNVLDRIVRAAALQSGQRALEIGPGLGALTRSLAAVADFVTAVEIDPLLLPILDETLADAPNTRVVRADFLEVDLPRLLDEAFGGPPGVVVASIPFYITSPIVERLLAHRERIARIVLLVQREFADRLVAAPGTKDYGSMSVFAQYHTTIEIVGRAAPGNFLPPPEVESRIVTLDPVVPGTVAVRDVETFFRLVHAAFGQRRKTLLNALSGGDVGLDRPAAEALLTRAGIDPSRRGETLSLLEFARLADARTFGESLGVT